MTSNEIQFNAADGPTVPIYIHRLLPLAIVYFFLNSAGLPIGLFYTSMLSPLLYLWLIKEGKRWVSVKFIACLSLFIVMQVYDGLNSPFYYLRSILLLWTVYVTVYAFLWALLKCKNIERLFEELMVLNLCAAPIALVILFTPAKELLWNMNLAQTAGSGGWTPRLQLLTSEPSAYGELMAPLLIFSAMRLINNPTGRNFLYLVIIAIPMLLSQSFGAISICAAGIGIAVLFTFRHALRQWRAGAILVLGALFVIGLIMVPNPIGRRVAEVASGNDSSIHTRTLNAYILAYAIAGTKSIWWGVGVGQAKLYDNMRVLKTLGYPNTVLPDTTADTLANMGIVAVLIKFVLEIYLYYRTRVYSSPFRLAIFAVVFVYQFTGGNLMSIQEYLLWGFAFMPIIGLEPQNNKCQ